MVIRNVIMVIRNQTRNENEGTPRGDAGENTPDTVEDNEVVETDEEEAEREAREAEDAEREREAEDAEREREAEDAEREREAEDAEREREAANMRNRLDSEYEEARAREDMPSTVGNKNPLFGSPLVSYLKMIPGSDIVYDTGRLFRNAMAKSYNLVDRALSVVEGWTVWFQNEFIKMAPLFKFFEPKKVDKTPPINRYLDNDSEKK